MKILSLQVEQFRKFDQAVLVDDFGDGLNLIAGPNETGKSTLLLALRAALFERHGAKTQAVKDFAPHHVTGARPTIILSFDIAGERYRLRKSFLKRAEAKLETSKGRRFEGADAERELKRLLGLNPVEKTSAGKDSPQHFGVLLTPQARSFQQAELADGTRHSLEAAIAADIAELGNQSEVDGLMAEFEARLFEIVSKRGEPKNRYKEVTARLDDIEREITDATGERTALRDRLDSLEEAIDERRRLQADDDRENLPERLASLEAARTRAIHRQTLENRRLAASQRLQAAEAKRAAGQARLEERRRITGEIETVERTAAEVRNRLETVEETLSQHVGKLADLSERLRAARQRRRDLEMLGQQVERSRQIDSTLAALATDVRLELEENAFERLTLNGEPPAALSELRQVTEGLAIDIEGVGRIGIEPKIEPMREALAAKDEVENEIGHLLRTLDLDHTDQDAIETVWQTVAADMDSWEKQGAEIETVLAEERRQAAEAKAALAASAERRTGLGQRLAEIDTIDSGQTESQAALDAEITAARAAFEEADSAWQAGQHDTSDAAPEPSPAPERLEAEIADLRHRIERRRGAIEEAGRTVVALESAIAVQAGLGLDEKIDQLERQRHLLTEERDAFALDHRALSLLQDTLREAADEAKTTFNAPLSARLAPYIRDLFPGTTPLVTPDFSIRALDRNGVDEPFPQLSDGTREQIAILARLAFADMLREQGLPALVVLDDALAFSDSERLSGMLGILERAAERMQIIILTCREDSFEPIRATRLQIAPVVGEASSAA